ncbi:MAG: hypothetical protein RMY34_26015 [Aulosira sp. DedQUE10]|nr:hypothetical protein [Aulosira sp. DedQUE10]
MKKELGTRYLGLVYFTQQRQLLYTTSVLRLAAAASNSVQHFFNSDINQ